MAVKPPGWRTYERIVAGFESENVGIDVSITPNAKIVGSISGHVRQVDVLLDARWGDEIDRRIIVDAKYRRRKLDINDVEQFESMMRDCRAQHGYLVCTAGWSPAAERRAQEAITIKLLSVEGLEDPFLWAHFSKCVGSCATANKRKDSGLVLWDGHYAVPDLCSVVYTGKCDACHQFHVHCLACGMEFALADEAERECWCGDRIWVTAIEEEQDDATGGVLNAVHSIVCEGSTVIPLDRRALR